MPITKSAKKALRVERRRRIINLKAKDNFKKVVKIFKKTPNKKNFKAFVSAVDKAVKGKLIHKNKAARLKSRASLQAAS